MTMVAHGFPPLTGTDLTKLQTRKPASRIIILF